MKKYFILYKPFLRFLGAFFLTYIVLTFLYQVFLDSFGGNKLDSITKIVGKNTKLLLSWYDNDIVIVENKQQTYLELVYHQIPVAQIIEGCNAISVIILFVSFVIAFSGKLKNTLLFVFGGSLIIYVLNVFRIAILTVLMFHFPDQEHFLHGVVFPLFIYGVVFILWVIWVRKFSRYAK